MKNKQIFDYRQTYSAADYRALSLAGAVISVPDLIPLGRSYSSSGIGYFCADLIALTQNSHRNKLILAGITDGVAYKIVANLFNHALVAHDEAIVVRLHVEPIALSFGKNGKPFHNVFDQRRKVRSFQLGRASAGLQL